MISDPRKKVRQFLLGSIHPAAKNIRFVKFVHLRNKQILTSFTNIRKWLIETTFIIPCSTGIYESLPAEHQNFYQDTQKLVENASLVFLRGSIGAINSLLLFANRSISAISCYFLICGFTKTP